MIIEFDMIQSLAAGVLILAVGQGLKMQISFLSRNCIPAPVVGGVIFALLSLLVRNSGGIECQFDSTLQTVLMTAFFCTVGFSASLKTLRNGGIKVALFLSLAVVLVLLQNIVGLSCARLFDINPLLGLSTGSIPMTGGHGTSGAFAPVFESAGAVGATTVAMASATFGLVAGSMIGGPIGKLLVRRNRLLGEVDNSAEFPQGVTLGQPPLLDSDHFFLGTCQVILVMGGGTVIAAFLQKTGVIFPHYIGAMVLAASYRNITDLVGKPVRLNEIAVIGDTSLALFVAMAMMNLKLWQLADLAGTLLLALAIQTMLMAAFAYFITFNIMGRNYEAAVMACGHCGFGMGATPNALINMSAMSKQYGGAPEAFIVIPLVGSLFIDFFNAGIITVFVNFFQL